MNEKELSKLVDDALVKCWEAGYESFPMHVSIDQFPNRESQIKPIADELKKALGLVPLEDGGRVVD